MSPRVPFAVWVAELLFCGTAQAQFNNVWAEFERVDGRIRDASGAVATHVTADVQEKDYAWGDLDQDGWIDLVVARTQPWLSSVGQANHLLMNEGGLLVDRSAQYASAADVLGDTGFLTPTNDRDAVIVDVNLDGWLDVVTATAANPVQPKHISHPRIYINLGNDANGRWQGLRFENSRFPQLALTPRFNAVAAGDVTGDGAPDLFFADSGNLEDKLFVNDGSGNFTDSGTTHMPASMLASYYGLAAAIVDLNGDGANDVVRCTGNNGSGAGPAISVAYNDPANVGFFPISLYQFNVGNTAPYHVAVGDLNRDLRPDIVYVDDNPDGYRYNTGNNASGQVVWGPLKPYQFLTGFDDGFGGNIVIADLDGDGWNDTIHSDVDADISGCFRRAHVYHNPGGTIGGQITLLEEAEMAVGGWRGAKGLLSADLTGTFDIAVFDIDRDGDLDIVFGRCSGTFVWLNRRNVCAPVHYTYGQALPNSTGQAASILSNGNASLSANQLVLAARSMPAGRFGLFLLGTQRLWSPVPFGNGNSWIGGPIGRLPTQMTDANGNVTLAVDFGLPPLNSLAVGEVRDFQFLYRDHVGGVGGVNLTDALEIVVCP